MTRTTVQVITSSYRASALNASPLSGLFIEHRSEALTTRGGASIRLGASGRLHRPVRLTARTVVYGGIIQADPVALDLESDLRTKITTFEALMDLELHGDLVEGLENGSTRTLDVRPRNYSVDRVDPELAAVSVEFESWDTAEWQVAP